MVFVPNCGAIVASHQARMRQLEEDEKKKREINRNLLFGKGANFKVYEKMDVRFTSFEIDDYDFNFNSLSCGMNNRFREEVGNKKVINVQIVPFKVGGKKVTKWKVFVMYED